MPCWKAGEAGCAWGISRGWNGGGRARQLGAAELEFKHSLGCRAGQSPPSGAALGARHGHCWGAQPPGSFHCMGQCSLMGHFPFDQSLCGSDIRSSGHGLEGWVQTSSCPQCCQHTAGALGVAVLSLMCCVRVSSCLCRTRS